MPEQYHPENDALVLDTRTVSPTMAYDLADILSAQVVVPWYNVLRMEILKMNIYHSKTVENPVHY